MEWFFLWVALSAVVGMLASSKGRSFLGWTLLALTISPLIAGLIVLVAGSGRRCRSCGGDVPKDVTVCRHCGRDLVTGEPGPSRKKKKAPHPLLEGIALTDEQARDEWDARR